MLQKPVIERLIPKLAQPKIGPHIWKRHRFLRGLLNVRKRDSGRTESTILISVCTIRFVSHARRLDLARLHKLNEPFYSTPRIAWNHKGTLDSDDALHIPPSPHLPSPLHVH